MRRRRKRIGPALMAWGMLLVAGAVFGVFMYQASGFGEQEESLVASATQSKQNAPAGAASGSAGQQAERERFALAGSEVAGFDDERQPYRISASSARQDTEQPNLVHMNQITGKLRRADGRKMDINATTGLFNTRDKSLMLDGNVKIELQNTFVASMSTANVDVQKKALKSRADVLVEMDGGQIFSSGIEVSDNGAYVLFRSRVKAQFDDTGPATGTSSGNPDNAPTASADAPVTTTSKGNLQ
ncbi:MAG: LPS export ABC transporter periplasmic protein LptC [Anderseniella sp.]|nr:LPS export ABC transporter periplasmic protein LptC [Anderseniella sp.]